MKHFYLCIAALSTIYPLEQ